MISYILKFKLRLFGLPNFCQIELQAMADHLGRPLRFYLYIICIRIGGLSSIRAVWEVFYKLFVPVGGQMVDPGSSIFCSHKIICTKWLVPTVNELLYERSGGS